MMSAGSDGNSSLSSHPNSLLGGLSSADHQTMERMGTAPVHISAKASAALLNLPCDSNNNNNNNSDDTGKLSDDFESPLPTSLPAIPEPSLSIWSSHPDPQVWSAPTDLNLFSQPTTLLNRQPSNPDSSYDSDDADADLLTKIVSDIVDSTESPQNDPQLCVQSESISAILLGTQTQTSAVHDDVNRTLSDTLIQEYPEWNIPNFKELKLLESAATTTTAVIDPNDFDKISLSTEAEKPSAQSPKPKPKQEPKAAKPINHRKIYDPEKARLYEEKLKFAKKLGYTEDMVAVALAKVGYHVSKNDFLNELICIGNKETAKHKEKGDLHLEGCQPNDVKQLDSTVTSVAKSPDQVPQCSQLRPIVIDGSNVAISHGNKEFSSRGIQIAIDWFRARGHTEITAFVPLWRKQPGYKCDVPTIDRDILLHLEAERVLTFTPSKNVSGRLISCHDDRYILNLATANQGIVVSNDHFRDLVAENPDYRKVVDERQLMFIFVGDTFMPPDDPLGRNGPKLDQFLRFPDQSIISSSQPCPYSLKCTYGKKCKYFHPGRMQTTIADHLRDKQKLSGQNSLPLIKSKKALQPQNSLPVNLISNKSPATPKSKLCATQSIAYPFLASNAAFDASVQRFLQASAPLAKNMHPKLERQLTLNPFSNIIQVPSFSLVNLPSSSSSHSHSHLSPSTSTASRTPHGARPKQKLSQTKSNPVPTVDLISPFTLSSSAVSKSSQNLDK